MQKLFYLLLFTTIAYSAEAQFKVMFVDDSGDAFGNAELLASSLDSLGYDYIYIDAYGNNLGPTAAEMSEYDLVIWHTSSWGLNLQLWGGGDTTNSELEQYLSQPDANLWLIGLDFMFDRYGVAPVDFQQGDFVFDRLGISKYANQSYADDGSLGVPLVTPAPAQPITGLGDINWQFSTLWYADGFELRPEATPVYLFGGAGYSLAGTPTGVWYHPAGGARVLTYGFDLSLASGFDLIRDHVDTVLQWWEGELTAVQSPAGNLSAVQASPNPFSDRLEIRINTVETTPVSVRIYDTTGRLIAQITDHEVVPAGNDKVFYWQTTADLPDGMYCCTVQSGQGFRTAKVLKQSR